MRRFNFVIALLFLCVYPAASFSQEVAYPSGLIRLVPCCAGTVENLSRVLAEVIGQKTNSKIIVDPRPGAAGMLAARYVRQEAPNGLTLLVSTGQHAANELLFKDVGYDYARDFTPVMSLFAVPIAVYVNADLPYKTLSELVLAAKQKPNSITAGYGSTTSQIGLELLKQITSSSFISVPYKTNPQVSLDLISGRIMMTVGDIPSNLPYVREGKLRALAVSSPARLAELPDVPTMEEAGVTGYNNFGSWIGLWAPPSTPASIISQVYMQFSDALATPSVSSFLKSNVIAAFPQKPEEFAKYQVTEHDRWARIVSGAGIQKE